MVILRKLRKRKSAPRKRKSLARKNPIRRRRRARRNPTSMATIRRRRRVAARKGTLTRPRLYKYKRKVYRGPNSKSKYARINPRRRRYRRNPALSLKGLFSKGNLMTYAAMAAGMVGGMMAMPFVVKAMRSIDKTGQYDKYYGVVHIVLGGLLVGFVKNKSAKLAGTTLAATGLYDLIASNTDIGLVPLPRASTFANSALPAPVASNYDLRGSYGVPSVMAARRTMAANYQMNGSFDDNMPGDTAWD